MTVERVDFDLEALVEGAVELMATAADAKGLEIGADIALSLRRRFNGDPTRLRQVLVNLLGNAVKFTEHGFVGVEVEEMPDGLIRVSVSDTGIGIAARDLSKLFEKFSQADDTVMRQFGGTGLGLAISRQLVEVMGGRIQVQSAVGRGSRFWFELPLGEATTMPLDGPPLERPFDVGQAPVAAAVQALPPMIEPGLKLLLVEDNQINQMVASTLLEADGYLVAIAEDGLEALEMAAQDRFDAILMDVQMPRLDGIGATLRLRQSQGPNQRTPIIALTADAMEGDRERYLSVGMNDYLSKPFELEAVRAVLARWVGGGAGTPAAVPNRPVQRPPEIDALPVLDESRLAGLEARIAAPKFRTMIEAFRENADQRLRRMAEARAAADIETLERESHSLAGAAGNVGALQLAAVARRIELACKTAGFDDLEWELDALRQIIPMAKDALSDRFLKRDEASMPARPEKAR